jgi:hypothetical protein
MSSNEVACETTTNASQRLRRYSASCGWPLHWLALAGIGGRVERVMGIEPTLAAWEAAVLPLNYTRAND